MLEILVVALGAALIWIPQCWKITTHAITLIHELGHALLGLLSGASVASIKIHKDSSGVTASAHPLNNLFLSRAITTFWGYPAPALIAATLLVLMITFGSHWAWYTALGLGVVCLVFIRNIFGFFVTSLWVAITGIPIYLGPTNEFYYYPVIGLISFLFFGGIHDLVNLSRLYQKRADEGSDIQALRGITLLPAIFWLILMWITAVLVIPASVWALLVR